MLHFPSKLATQGANGIPRRSDSLNLNATQQRSASHPVFLKVEEELHDARRVHSDGQEDDLRYALSMVINRVSELSSMLGEAYKTQAELEVQLNVAKSNLQLVIANNEMLEEALKRDTSGQSKDVGWRRPSGRDNDPRASVERSQSLDYSQVSSDPSPPPSASTPTSASTQDNRFFQFRFSSSSATTSRPATRPGTPGSSPNPAALVHPHHLTSPSMPLLSSARSKELEEITAELEKERIARKSIFDEKKALEEELESLSQALFEEANNMVATERKMRAEMEEELNDVKQEKEALKSALRLIEGQNLQLQESSSPRPEIPTFSRPHSRSSSQIGVKSRPQSLVLYPPLPPSPSPNDEEKHFSVDTSVKPDQVAPSPTVFSPEEESQPTPRYHVSTSLPPSRPDDPYLDASPWADVPSSAPPPSNTFMAAAFSGIR
ncbi:hypothetical protein M413DRAFT_345424 [Hebeloma cylindrosporum]|uniref:GDP/GTP exchange factor Sec2 N-terminal domain-containing protein n=1 Tax=Hebeloma cylindrosporum TaxID=76867 RepID=A0A0C2Y767_HEBCY|nr:hypothetical protein M413DRAFT_345424 [Hebeloma cylindrosporum h7]